MPRAACATPIRPAGRVVVGAAGALALTVYLVWQVRHRNRWVGILTNRIPAHHEYWRERGRVQDGSVLYVAIGDSAALGIGASQPAHGYVGVLAQRLRTRTGRPVRVRNLAIDGARVATCIAEELPRLPAGPDVVTVAVGGNDVWTFEPERFARELDQLLAALPSHTIVGEVPSFSPVPVAARVARMNAIVHAVAGARGMRVAPVFRTTARGGVPLALRNVAGDFFHPNDRGHIRWAEAFEPAIDARADALGREPAD